MANIILTLDHTIQDGEDIKFKAPCACNEVAGLTVNYPEESGDGVITTSTKTFTFRDSHGNDLTGLGELFVEGAYVKVIVDTENGYAYLQNADTNGYLEEKIGSGGGAGWTLITRNFLPQRNTTVFGWNDYTMTFSEPIEMPLDGLVEFELVVFGAGSSGARGVLTLVDSSGATMGQLVINGSGYGATRRSTCILDSSIKAYAYTEEGEDYVSAIQNSVPWSRSYGVSHTSSQYTIPGCKWSSATDIKCYGYFLRYRIMEV